MARYNEMVMEHFKNPRNVGDLENSNGTAEVSNPACGDTMRLTIRVEDDRIVAARFRTLGCAAAIAAGSLATEMITGIPLEEARALTNQAIVDALGGLPPLKMHCSVLAADAIRAAIADYQKRSQQKA